MDAFPKGKTDICQFFFSFFFYEPFPYNDELILRSVAAEAVIRSSWAAQSLNDLWALAGGGRSCSSRGGRTQGKALGARPIIIVLLPPCHLHQQHHHVCHFQLHRVSAGESGGRLRELVEDSGFFGGIFAGGSCVPVSAWTRSRWVRWQAITWQCLCHLCFSCINHHEKQSKLASNFYFPHFGLILGTVTQFAKLSVSEAL